METHGPESHGCSLVMVLGLFETQFPHLENEIVVRIKCSAGVVQELLVYRIFLILGACLKSGEGRNDIINRNIGIP